jgi:hypothetical protein
MYVRVCVRVCMYVCVCVCVCVCVSCCVVSCFRAVLNGTQRLISQSHTSLACTHAHLVITISEGETSKRSCCATSSAADQQYNFTMTLVQITRAALSTATFVTVMTSLTTQWGRERNIQPHMVLIQGTVHTNTQSAKATIVQQTEESGDNAIWCGLWWRHHQRMSLALHLNASHGRWVRCLQGLWLAPLRSSLL